MTENREPVPPPQPAQWSSGEGLRPTDKVSIRWLLDHVPITWWATAMVVVFGGGSASFYAGFQAAHVTLLHQLIAPLLPPLAYGHAPEDIQVIKQLQQDLNNNQKQLDVKNNEIRQMKAAAAAPGSLPSDIVKIDDLTGQLNSMIAQLEAKNKELENARRNPQLLSFSPFEPGPVLKRKLIRKEAEELIIIVSELSDIAKSTRSIVFHSKLINTSETHMISHDPPSYFPYGIYKDGPQDAIYLLKNNIDEISELRGKIDKIIANNNKYERELMSMVGRTGMDEIHNAARKYISKLETANAEKCISALALSAMLDNEAKNLRIATEHFRAWASSFLNRRAPAVRIELEAFL